MHLQLRTVYLLFILLSFLNCTTKDVRLANPATPEDSVKQGVVAFGKSKQNTQKSNSFATLLTYKKKEIGRLKQKSD
jgi:hypothetical protein